MYGIKSSDLVHFELKIKVHLNVTNPLSTWLCFCGRELVISEASDWLKGT